VAPNGVISTAAGSATAYGHAGDGGPATNASLTDVAGLALDSAGDLFIADYYTNGVIRKVDSRGIISTVAGDGFTGFSGDGGPATSASLRYPYGVAVNGSGDLFIADYENDRIRVVVPYGAAPMLALADLSATNAGAYQVVVTSPFGSVTSAVATLTVLLPPSVVVQPASQYVVAGSDVTLEVRAAGTPPLRYAWQRYGSAIAGATASSYTVDDVPLADSGSPFTCVVTNAYGSVTSEVATLTVGLPPAITAQPSNQTAQAGNNATFGLRLSGTGPFFYQWQFDGTNLPGGLIYTVAGNGNYIFSGDGGPATNASLDYPVAVALDASGNLFIADWDQERVRKVDTNGIITTLAGNGDYGYSGDGGAATNASLRGPDGVAVDAWGNVFIADQYNNRVRMVGTNGIITTVAGTGTAGYSGDGGAATNAMLDLPSGVAVDASGSLFFGDRDNDVVRKVDTNGIITTVAGNGTSGYAGDGGPATHANMGEPYGIALDAAGDLFITDGDNDVIRKVDTNGIITTVAGNGEYGFSGDGGAATNATFQFPAGVAVDEAGNMFIADGSVERVREVDVISGIITTFAGSGAQAYSNTNGVPATSVSFDEPDGVAVDGAGNVFIADSDNDLIHKVVPFGAAPTLTLSGVAANNAGSYQVIVTSPYGSVTSSVVTLTVLSSGAAPVISSIARNANGSVTLSLLTAPNASSRVQATTNLAHPAVWLPVYTNANAGSTGQWQFTDTNAANYHERFYRASTP
jgi:sugar lactone lactonase YvrE